MQQLIAMDTANDQSRQYWGELTREAARRNVPMNVSQLQSFIEELVDKTVADEADALSGGQFLIKRALGGLNIEHGGVALPSPCPSPCPSPFCPPIPSPSPDGHEADGAAEGGGGGQPVEGDEPIEEASLPEGAGTDQACIVSLTALSKAWVKQFNCATTRATAKGVDPAMIQDIMSKASDGILNEFWKHTPPPGLFFSWAPDSPGNISVCFAPQPRLSSETSSNFRLYFAGQMVPCVGRGGCTNFVLPTNRAGDGA
jgi:hypothetical protein